MARSGTLNRSRRSNLPRAFGTSAYRRALRTVSTSSQRGVTMGRESETIIIAGEIKVSTGEAWLVTLDNGEEVWLPKSECHHYAEHHKFSVPRWLADKKGISDG